MLLSSKGVSLQPVPFASDRMRVAARVSGAGPDRRVRRRSASVDLLLRRRQASLEVPQQLFLGHEFLALFGQLALRPEFELAELFLCGERQGWSAHSFADFTTRDRAESWFTFASQLLFLDAYTLSRKLLRVDAVGRVERVVVAAALTQDAPRQGLAAVLLVQEVCRGRERRRGVSASRVKGKMCTREGYAIRQLAFRVGLPGGSS
jgi:hypothetical protein